MHLRLPALFAATALVLAGLAPTAAADEVEPTATMALPSSPLLLTEAGVGSLQVPYSCSSPDAIALRMEVDVSETLDIDSNAHTTGAVVNLDCAATSGEAVQRTAEVDLDRESDTQAAFETGLATYWIRIRYTDTAPDGSLTDVTVAEQSAGDLQIQVPTPPPAPRAAVSLTANASPEPVVMGKRITVTGTLRRGGQAYTKRAAQLQFRTATGSYHTLKSVTSSSPTGRLKATVRADRSGCFRYSFSGNTDTKAGASPGDCVKVTTPALYTCSGTAQRRPTTIQLSCGDGNGYFDQVRWSHWTGTYATGTARQWYNTCKPDCAAGHYIKTRVAVHLYSPTILDFQRYFSRIFVRAAKSYRESTPQPRRGCVSNAEYNSVKRQQTRAKVERTFDTTGRGTSRHRSYASCTQYPDLKVYAEVWYKNGKVRDCPLNGVFGPTR